MTIKQVIIVTS